MEINETYVKELIENEIKSRLTNEFVEEILRDVIKETIQKNFVNEWTCKGVATDIFKERVKELLDKPIATDDGWGRKTTYTSFEELFKQTLKKKVDDSGEIKYAIERTVEEEIKQVVKTQAKEIMAQVNAIVTEKLSKMK